MRLVIDTNIFISAFYWGGTPQKIIDRVIEGTDKLFISENILNEIAAVMARPKFKSSFEIIEKYIHSIKKFSRTISVTGNIKGVCRDKDDDDKIECALLSSANYLITGDIDLLTLGNYKNIKIITGKEYLKLHP
jgi:putative PIN family toxin of toxin-antitoxin system